MRQELLESYLHTETKEIANRIIREVVDYEDLDHKSWTMMSSGTASTVGMTDPKDMPEMDAATARKMAFRLYNGNPYARGIVRTMGKFIFGKGVTTELAEENKGKKKKAEEYIKEWQDVNHWDMSQKETNNRSFRDGETFWYNRKMGRKKVPRLEFIEPDRVGSNRANCELGIEMEPKDPTTVKNYYVKKDASNQDGDPIPGEDIIHIKLFVDRNVKRGRTLFEPIFPHLKMHDDWLHARMVLNKVRSAVALVRYVEGTQPQGQVIRRATESSKDTRRTNKTQVFRPGTIITAPANTKYEMLQANLGASDAAQDGRNILLAIAVGVGFPEMFLTGDYSNANFASTSVAQSPFVREFEDWQDFFDFYIKQEYKRVLELGIDVGLVDKDTSLEVNNEWPELTYEDFVANVTALGQLFQNEILSKHTYAARLDIDYDEEQKLIEEEQAAQAAKDIGDFGDEFGGGGEDQPPEDVEDLAASTYAERRSLRRPEGEEEIEEAKRDEAYKARAAVRKNRAAEEKRLGRKLRRMGSGTIGRMGSLTQGDIRKEVKQQAKEHLKDMGATALAARLKRNEERQAAWEKRGVPDRLGVSGTTNVRAHTRKDPRTGKIEQVDAHVRHLSRSQMQKIMEEGEIAKVKEIHTGDTQHVNEVYIVDLKGKDGTVIKAVFKPHAGEGKKYAGVGFPEMYKHEHAASAVAEALGGMERYMPVVAIRDVTGKGVGAMIEYINSGMKDALDFNFNDVLRKFDGKEIGKIAAFDYIVGNNDRHQGNWKTDGKGRIGLIDHGMTFPHYNTTKLRSGIGVIAQKNTSISIRDSIGNSWDHKWPAIEKILKANSSISATAVKNTKARFDEVIKAKDRGDTLSKLSKEFRYGFIRDQGTAGNTWAAKVNKRRGKR